MICASCGCPNADERKFCGLCGAPLSISCTACGAPNRAAERFCAQCGKPLDGAPAAAAPPSDSATIDALASSTIAERPNLGAHAAPDGTVTILITDIEDSTPMTERLGDLRAREVMAIHNRIVREQVASAQGYEVKSVGDGFMIAFSSARRASQCAIGIQRAFAAYCRERRKVPIRVRIGVHTGEAIREEGGDFFGKAVIMAARIGALAQAGEILVSAIVKEVTQDAGDFRYDEGREVPLKGLAGTHRVFRLEWEESGRRPAQPRRPSPRS